MAQTAQITSLIVGLIQSTIKNVSDSSLERHKCSALAVITNASSERVNQFDVSSRLEGLEEKARILNNDPLADALLARLHELSTISDRWNPEFLSLLLHLSERPIHESRVEDLVLLRPVTPPPPLTWSDIIADDPLDYRDGIWSNVNFAADGSDDDYVLEPDDAGRSDTSPSRSQHQSKVSEIDLEKMIVTVDDPRSGDVNSLQYWTEDLKKATEISGHESDTLLTEAQAVREVIFMLLGLPTKTFSNGHVVISRGISIRHVSLLSVTTLLEAFAGIGTKLNNVRQWNEERPTIPLEQTFVALLSSSLADIDRKLSEIEFRILDPCSSFVPTLLSLHEEISCVTRLIQQLDDVLVEVSAGSGSIVGFRILERLFESSCASQRIGDEEGYEFMAGLFFESFRTYLKPIRLWMERGQLSERDRVMFVQKSAENVPLGSLWQDQYSLVTDADGNLHAPNFLHLAAKKIFNTGKSVDFLKHLGHDSKELGAPVADELEMCFQNVCLPTDLGSFSPFPELFDMALDNWITNKHHSSSSMLRSQLETQCGLQRSLDALEYIFFGRNGALSSNIANVIFEWMERGSHKWNDSFVLTELFQSSYHNIACVDPGRLDVRVGSDSSKYSLHRARRSVGVLQKIHICYNLPWAIANIIKPEYMPIYRRVSVLLLQIQRAKYLLQRRKLTHCLPADVNRLGLLIRDMHHRLLWFVNTIFTYVAQMVVSASASSMRTAMRLAVDVDGMIEVHDTYMKQLESRCFLSKPHGSIRQAVSSLLDLTVLFSDIQASFMKDMGLSMSEKGMISKHKLDHTSLSAWNGILESDPSDESDADADTGAQAAPEHSDLDRLRHVRDTFSKLLSFLTAAIQGVSKADGAICYEMLAASLAAGLN